jgi:hypothetical protein
VCHLYTEHVFKKEQEFKMKITMLIAICVMVVSLTWMFVYGDRVTAMVGLLSTTAALVFMGACGVLDNLPMIERLRENGRF